MEREADLREVMVRGQDFAQLELAHDNKARAVRERKILVVITEKEAAGLVGAGRADDLPSKE